MPLSVSLAMFRLSAEEFLLFPGLEYLLVDPHVCSLLSYLKLTWICLVSITTLTSVLFRFLKFTTFTQLSMISFCVLVRSILVKYSDRGLADDVLWFNGGLVLFEKLFGIFNLIFISLPQIFLISRFLEDQEIQIFDRYFL